MWWTLASNIPDLEKHISNMQPKITFPGYKAKEWSFHTIVVEATGWIHRHESRDSRLMTFDQLCDGYQMMSWTITPSTATAMFQNQIREVSCWCYHHEHHYHSAPTNCCFARLHLSTLQFSSLVALVARTRPTRSLQRVVALSHDMRARGFELIHTCCFISTSMQHYASNNFCWEHHRYFFALVDTVHHKNIYHSYIGFNRLGRSCMIYALASMYIYISWGM
jgi:hypothetical protein